MEHADKVQGETRAAVASSGEAPAQGADLTRVPDDRPGGDPDVRSVLDRVTVLVDGNQLTVAQQELEAALAALGEHAELLERLADVQSDRGYYEAAVAHLARAAAMNPGDASVLSAYANLLSRIGLKRQAIDFVTELPKEIGQDPNIRAALGDIYADGGWHALAVDAYGDPAGLASFERRARRRSWWRSGGPIRFVRRRMRRLNDEMRRTWLYFSKNLPVLDTLDRPQGFAGRTRSLNHPAPESTKAGAIPSVGFLCQDCRPPA